MDLSYNNFDVYNPTITLDMLVWSICGGIILGAVGTYVNRLVIGRFTKTLLKDEHRTPETAITLEQAGAGKNIFLRHALRTGAPLRKLILCANEDEFAPPETTKFGRAMRKIFSMDDPEPKTDMAKARFFIPEENAFTAEAKYSEKGSTLPNLILSIILVAAVGFGAKFIIPELFTMLDNFLTIIG